MHSAKVVWRVLQFLVSVVHILSDCGNLTFLISMKFSLCLTFPLKGSFIALDYSFFVIYCTVYNEPVCGILRCRVYYIELILLIPVYVYQQNKTLECCFQHMTSESLMFEGSVPRGGNVWNLF
jgi:hypothetical protein